MAAYTEDDQGNKSSGRLVVVAVIGAVLAVWFGVSIFHQEFLDGANRWAPRIAEIPESVLMLVGLAITGKLSGSLIGEGKATSIISAIKAQANAGQ